MYIIVHLPPCECKVYIIIMCNRSFSGEKIKVFHFGDYQYLSIMYGMEPVVNAYVCMYNRHKLTLHYMYMSCTYTGRHCCLFCTVKSENLKIPPHSRQHQAEIHTVATLKSDHTSFVLSGGNLRQAKQHNNVIRQLLFDILMANVSIIYYYLPTHAIAEWIYLNGAHRLPICIHAGCSAGLTYQSGYILPALYTARRCIPSIGHNLCETNATTMDEESDGGPSFLRYMNTMKIISELHSKRDVVQARVDNWTQLHTLLMLTLPNPEQTTQLSREECQKSQKELKELVSERKLHVPTSIDSLEFTTRRRNQDCERGKGLP